MSSPRLHVAPSDGGPLVVRSDDELMTLAQAGVRDAFAVLVERHAARLISACTRFVSDAQTGRDLA
jgi:DNA-directed RNA polymerase specialized sigma24 family protein